MHINISNREIPEINKMQLSKKKYFDKIINWFTLFDNYAKQITENSALGNFKDVIEAYIHNMQSNHNDLDSGNQSALLFQINLQRCDFLKGKFAFACKNYSDALGFMINAAKKKRIVIDGLIKKRALKHIAKIAEKTRKIIIANSYSKYNYFEISEKMKNNSEEYKNLRKKSTNKSMDSNSEDETKKETPKKTLKLIDKIKELIDQIKDDINETNEKQSKDIIVLIDCNLANKSTIDSYIDVVKTLLKNYLTNNDRIGVFTLENEYKNICPIASKNEIDNINFSKILDTTSENLFKKEKIELTSINDIIQEKEPIEELYSSRNSDEESFSVQRFMNENGYIKDQSITVEEMINALNYCLAYLKMKEISTNEKYFIYFNSNMKILMNYLNDNEQKELSEQKKKVKLLKEKKINFLLVGKLERNNEELYNEILCQYFGTKSEVIPYDNMKKIKSIFSSNNIINDNITFPNEVYK